MSSRYAKTSSRGRAITVETLSGSMAARSLGGGGQPAHRAVVLGVRDDLRALRLGRVGRPAEGADEGVAAVEVDALAGQRRASAVSADVAIAPQGAEALAQELAL